MSYETDTHLNSGTDTKPIAACSGSWVTAAQHYTRSKGEVTCPHCRHSQYWRDLPDHTHPIFVVYAQTHAGPGVHRCCDADGCLRMMVNRLMDNGAKTMLIEELDQERIPTFARAQQQSCCDCCGYTLTYAWQVAQ